MNYKIEDEIVEFELAMKAKEAGFSNGSKYAYIYNAEDAKSSFCNMSMVVYNTDNSGFVEAPTASVLNYHGKRSGLPTRTTALRFPCR